VTTWDSSTVRDVRQRLAYWLQIGYTKLHASAPEADHTSSQRQMGQKGGQFRHEDSTLAKAIMWSFAHQLLHLIAAPRKLTSISTEKC